ncbi:MAG: 3-coathanger stack domain-containing protein, partial [Saprospiraceae bacterium]
ALNVYVTLSGFSDGLKVYSTIDGGTNWDNISGSLPNIPMNCIVYDENGSGGDALYIGSDIGVFYRNNTIGDWVYFSTPLQAVNINDLYINDSDNTIVAGTYGRGLWRSDKYTGCVSSITLLNIPGAPAGGVKYFSSSGTITSNVIYKTELGTEIHYKASNYVDLQNDFLAGSLAFFEAKTGNCPDIVNDPLVSPFISVSIFAMTEPKKAVCDEVK